jgi:hypothetical protein
MLWRRMVINDIRSDPEWERGRLHQAADRLVARL